MTELTALTSTSQPLAMLVGNGLSLAFNPELGIHAVCEEILHRVQQDADATDADAITTAMRRAAEATGRGDPMLDFEVLVGAFVTEGSFMQRLKELSSYIDPQDAQLSAAFDRIAVFSESLRWRGVSHVLEVISERTVAETAKKYALNTFIDSILNRFTGRVTISNLNYDTLLLSSLTENHSSSFCDMASGYGEIEVSYGDKPRFWARPIRTGLNFPDTNRVRLLQLHGSLTWWRGPEGKVYKFPVDEVRDPQLWAEIRKLDYDDVWFPEVVLANQSGKSAQIQQYPFSLAYKGFARSLRESDTWIIAGYSFRDEPVNEKLREAFDEKQVPPNVFVVTKGDVPSKSDIEKAFSWPAASEDSKNWLTIIRTGVETIENVDLFGATDLVW